MAPLIALQLINFWALSPIHLQSDIIVNRRSSFQFGNKWTSDNNELISSTVTDNHQHKTPDIFLLSPLFSPISPFSSVDIQNIPGVFLPPGHMHSCSDVTMTPKWSSDFNQFNHLSLLYYILAMLIYILIFILKLLHKFKRFFLIHLVFAS